MAWTDNWEWISAILGCGVVGAIMAILRHVFGKPKLEFKFVVTDLVFQGEDTQALICKLTNSPFRNIVMKLFFVPRPRIDAISVLCEMFDRMDCPATRYGKAFWADMVTYDGNVAKQLSLPSSVLPIWFLTLVYRAKYDKAWLPNTDEGEVSLKNGVLYILRVTAQIGDKQIKAYAGCAIKNKIHFIYPLPKELIRGAL